MEVKGKRGKPSVMVTEDDEFKKVIDEFEGEKIHVEYSKYKTFWNLDSVFLF